MNVEVSGRSPVSSRTTRLLFSANGQVLSLAARNAEFREALQQADLVHADGQAIVFASRRIPGHGIPERSATTDLIHDLSRRAPGEGLSFFLLGGDEDLNARCARTLERLYPGLIIAGRRNGYFDRSQESEVCEEINASGADIVWVGLGKPTGAAVLSSGIGALFTPPGRSPAEDASASLPVTTDAPLAGCSMPGSSGCFER